MNDWMCEKSQPKGYWIWVWSTSWNAAINATWSICTFLNATISTLSTRGKMGSESPKKGHQNAACMTDYSLFEKCLGIYFTISKKWKIPIFGKPNPIPHLTWLEGRPKHFCEVVSSTEKKRVSLSIDEITIVVFLVWMQAAPGARCIPRGFEKQPSSF